MRNKMEYCYSLNKVVFYWLKSKPELIDQIKMIDFLPDIEDRIKTYTLENLPVCSDFFFRCLLMRGYKEIDWSSVAKWLHEERSIQARINK